MRTIKFRGKGRKTGKWFYGNLYAEDSFGRTHICTPERSCLDIDPDTVGQFTGFYDKDGKEIYEGDILRCDEVPNVILKVYWNDEIVAFCLTDDIYKEHGYADTAGYILQKYSCEVVGNIYDNPELIKGGAK